MAKKCPPGVICTDSSTIWLVVIVAAIAAVVYYLYQRPRERERERERPVQRIIERPQTVYVMQPPAPPPIRQYNRSGAVQQVGILTGEGGSSSSAAPDRTILPLFGRELNVRRGRWNYYSRTDGSNPIQVPVRFGNRQCDDDTNGCNEVFDGDSVHVPALGRSFKATIYKVAF